MADAIPTDTSSGPSAEPWTRRKALAVITAAWAAWGLLAVLVFAGSVALTMLFMGDADLYQRIVVVMALVVLSWLLIFWIGIRTRPNDDDGVDYAEIPLRPTVPVLAVLAATTAALFAIALPTDGMGHGIVAAMLPMIISATVLDVHLGPRIRRRCPELWSEAVRRSEARNRHVAVIGQALAATVVIVPVFLIVLIIAKGMFGE